jgi:hypothetical protein
MWNDVVFDIERECEVQIDVRHMWAYARVTCVDLYKSLDFIAALTSWNDGLDEACH